MEKQTRDWTSLLFWLVLGTIERSQIILFRKISPDPPAVLRGFIIFFSITDIAKTRLRANFVLLHLMYQCLWKEKAIGMVSRNNCVMLLSLLMFSVFFVHLAKAEKMFITRGAEISNKVEDTFKVARTLCSATFCSRFGGNRTNSSHPCECQCPHSNATFGFYSNRWKCEANEAVRSSFGK